MRLFSCAWHQGGLRCRLHTPRTKLGALLWINRSIVLQNRPGLSNYGHSTRRPSRAAPQFMVTATTKSMDGARTDVTASACAAVDNGPAVPASGGDLSTLDRDAFKQVLSVLALRVPNRKCAEMMKAFRGFTLDRPRLRCIVPDGSSTETKLLLLEEGVTEEGLPPDLRTLISNTDLTWQPHPHQVMLDYHMLSADTVLKRLLPPGVDAPSSFETIGHIAHLNLRDEQLPYRYLIGAVLLDKNPHLKTVVNKVGSIENEFRVFSMEVIAGEQRLETEVTQHGARFRLDFSQVYWNSRLESEHLRLVSSFSRGQVLVDMMAGIGPFAVPAAQRGLTVYANDLNPASARFMAVNVALNRLGSAVNVFNMDGRAFLRLLCDTPDGLAAQLRQQRQEQQQQQQQQEQQEQEKLKPQQVVAQSDGQQPQEQQEQPKEVPVASPKQPQHPQQQQTRTEDVQPLEGLEGDTGLRSHTPASGGKPPAKRQKVASQARQDVAAASSAPPPPVPPSFLPPTGGLLFDHVVMNLPASAIEFLDAFRGAFDPATWAERPLPMVHCYTFKRAAESEADILAKAEHYLGGALEPDSCVVHTVRDVAPNKLMLCLSFRVPRSVAFYGRLC